MKNAFCVILFFYIGFVAADPAVEGESLYQLDLDLTDQNGKHVGLDVFRGQPLLISMIYASCPHVCPLTISTIQLTESELATTQQKQLRVILVSFDSENDSVDKLADLAKRQKVDDSRWILARAEPGDVRKLAAVLGIRFRKLPDGGFNHSTIITLLDGNGVPVMRSTKLAHTNPALLAGIRSLLH